MKLNTSTKDLWKTVHTDNIQNWNFYVSKTGNYPSAWRQIHKGMQYVHTMWQFSARKRNKFELYRTHEWLSKTPGWMKEVRPKRTCPAAVHTEWSHLFEIPEQAKKKKYYWMKRRIHQKRKLYNIKKYRISVTSGEGAAGNHGKEHEGTFCGMSMRWPWQVGVWVTVPS